VVGYDAGLALVRDEGVAALAFTGSQAAGLALWRIANQRRTVIPTYAEMSTVNPVVVTRAAAATRMEEIAEGFVDSFTLGSGQFCTKPGLVFAPAGAAAVEAIGKALRQASPEPVMLTAAIARSTAEGLDKLRFAGARVVELVQASVEGWCAPAAVLEAPIDALQDGSRLLEECFGAVAVVVEYSNIAELVAAVERLQGSLVASVFTADENDLDAAACLALLSPKVGRLCANDWPTGVAYAWAQQHGGPWPSTSASWATSVGAAALDRFVRPVTYQSLRDEWLPPALQAANPWNLSRRVNGELQPVGATQ
jgi:NADP-dependent aldehyde dehydrogenase